ncbi:uncharacterized protein LOC133203256 [Saccostrea echinata]|uniref:uncharacterized protein LOC133203256 n=1 Tax=Saccostrea echinata TaxID=191078 RepID=UPI002A7ED911|nr:uncharacterized protein LOC133203256 [Saccostrea echinata]
MTQSQNNSINLSDRQEEVIKRFHSSVNTGPSFVCKSCSQIWFKHSVRKATGISEDFLHQHGFQKQDIICNTCHTYLKAEKVPPCSFINGLKFPSKPQELNINPLEERLIAPRIPFMQLREKPRGGQMSITGNVVNVPADVTSTVKKLPRLLSENETIPLKFKRSMSFKHSMVFERIRPNKVLAATQWLIQNSTLFKAEGIELNESWDCQDDESDDENELNSTSITNSVEETITEAWTEEGSMDDRPTGNMDTLMQSIDFREFNQVLSVAPGENFSPLSIFQDKNAEFLAFPTIYCGEARPDNKLRTVPLHYSTICKWELRNVDRRCAQCIPNLFYKLKRIQIKQIQDKVMLAMRKCKLQGKKYTAAQILDSQTADSIVRLNEGFHVLRNLRGSPPYWEKAKKDIFAMIRQLGLPTWFCSFSAAETKWTPLLKTLGELIDNVTYTEEEIRNMSWEHKSKLIKSDPVTCARYFDFRFNKFFAEVLSHKTNPVGFIEDFFYRIEFQQKGSPHVHMLLWIKDAPSVQTHSYEEVAQFIDKYAICEKHGADDFLINYQTHRHARTCMKKNKPICRFHFPIPPMPQTVVLAPLDDDDEHCSTAVMSYQKIVDYLNSSKFRESEIEMTFQDILLELQMNVECYIRAVRSTLKQEKVFLKRNPNEVRINAYNNVLLQSWQANMDIQFILDAYACATYIVSYISKGQRGMSNLLRHACEEARQNDSDIRQQVRRIGNKFLSHVEIDERVVLLKPRHVLEELKESSTDIEAGNITRLYQQRPKALEGICLADFVSWFQVKYHKENTKQNTSEELPENEPEEEISDDAISVTIDSCEFAQSYMFRNGTEIVKRKKPMVLRWQGGKALNDMENVLFNVDAEDLCADFIAPGNEHEEEIDREEGSTLSRKWGCFDPGKHAPDYDIGLELGIQRKQLDEEISQMGEMEDIPYREMLRGLNQQQREFFNHVLHWLKTKKEPLYAFLSGGAGVGKSVLTRALYQALLKFYSHQVHENPDNLHVLLCAPTGKAAHNINDSTIHAAFCIPVGRGFAYKPLDMQQLNVMRTRYMNLKVIFIDEISMYGPLAANLWRDNFKLFELTIIVRQRDDRTFAKLLNRLREGNQTEQDISVLCQCVKAETPDITNIPHLFTTRNEVQSYNNKIYDMADDSQKVSINAIDWVIGASEEAVKSKVLARVPDDCARTLGLSSILCLVIGVPAEITSNVNVQDGITNGASCTVKLFDYRVEGSTRCSIIWVQFDDDNIGKELRKEYARLFKSEIEKTWTPILEITRQFKIQMNAVLEEMNRLRNEGKMKVCIDNLGEKDPHTTVLTSFNIRSLHKHKEDLEKDVNLMASDVLAISETRLIETDDAETFSMPGYTMYRFDSPQHCTQRPSYGLAFYVKESLTVKKIIKRREQNVQFFSLDIEIHSGKSMLFLFLYIPPKTDLTTVKNMLRNMFQDCLIDSDPVVLTGDFNIDNLSPQTGNIIKFMSEFNLNTCQQDLQLTMDLHLITYIQTF